MSDSINTSGIISLKTAMDIAMAHREIETAEQLLADISEKMDRREVPDIRDAFGRSQDGLQLGIPMGNTGQRLFNVPWSLARPIIETHIANSKAKLVVLTELARAEISQ